MATAVSRNCCLVCGKEKATYKCEGCLKSYCKNHLHDHQKELELQLDEIENERNIFRQTLSEQVNQPNKHELIQRINEWERRSIKKIEETAEENRQLILKQTSGHFERIEIGLRNLTDEIKETRQENDFNELNLNDLRKKLEKLQQHLNNPASISLREDTSSSFINKIYVNSTRNIPTALKWKQNAITVVGGNGAGEKTNQLNQPWGIYIDDDDTLYVSDQFNHRIVAWKKGAISGEIVAGGNGEGSSDRQLSHPGKVIIDKVNDYLIITDYENSRVVRWPRRNGVQGETIIRNVKCVDVILHKDGCLYVSDEGNHEIRRWKIGEKEGVLVAGGNGYGSGLHQFNNPHFIDIDHDDTLYVSDLLNHRVMKWTKGAKTGIVVAGGHGEGIGLNQLAGPQGIFVDKLGTLYIADGRNGRIMRWAKDAKEGSIIAGGNNRGDRPNKLSRPIGLLLDKENNIYVTDYDNHRVQKFLVDN